MDTASGSMHLAAVMLSNASEACAVLLNCGCLKACVGNCKCAKAGLKCTTLCKCEGGCINNDT